MCDIGTKVSVKLNSKVGIFDYIVDADSINSFESCLGKFRMFDCKADCIGTGRRPFKCHSRNDSKNA